MATLKLGMKYKLEANFTRDQKEGHFTKSFDPHKLRNIHPSVNMDYEFNFFVNFMGPFLPELLFTIVQWPGGNAFFGVELLSFCEK
jgi:hypothetical protein